MKLPLQFLIALLLSIFISIDARLSVEASREGAMLGSGTSDSLAIQAEEMCPAEVESEMNADEIPFWGRRLKGHGTIVNNSGVGLVCRPETPPPNTIVVPNGGTAKIDGIMMKNGNVYKIVDGCTATVSAPAGGGAPTTDGIDIECDGFISWCAQKIRGGEVEPWW
mmetsp:Transcript_28072/g.47709  ORF Transcript_28072/g.47709 Transcript_28072/m.47709 type:complete len:166 (+) Transcript_28072:122-619(+)